MLCFCEDLLVEKRIEPKKSDDLFSASYHSIIAGTMLGAKFRKDDKGHAQPGKTSLVASQFLYSNTLKKVHL